MYKLGIDLGGTNIKIGLVDSNNKIIHQLSFKTDKSLSPEKFAKNINTHIETLLDKAFGHKELLKEQLESVGLGFPGAVSCIGYIKEAPNFGLKEINIKSLLEKELGCNVLVENDGNCAAIGEAISGKAQNLSSFIVLTLGTGIGSGIIIDGKFLSGQNTATGEVGHMVIEKNGLSCSCGRNGCFEKYASAKALIQLCLKYLEDDVEKKSAIWQIIDFDLKKLDGKTPFTALEKEDFLGKKILTEFTYNLSVGITNLINIFQPEAVIIGGAIAKDGKYILSDLREKINREKYIRDSLYPNIEFSELCNDAGIIGAANLHLKKFR